MLTFLLVCCLIPSCAGCKGRKGRARRREPQPVMLHERHTPTPRPAEVKQVPQVPPPQQRAPQLVQMAPVGEPVPYVKSEPGVQYIHEDEVRGG